MVPEPLSTSLIDSFPCSICVLQYPAWDVANQRMFRDGCSSPDLVLVAASPARRGVPPTGSSKSTHNPKRDCTGSKTMAPIPFLGRLGAAEYIALVGSFVLVGLEAVIRVLTLALRTYSTHAPIPRGANGADPLQLLPSPTSATELRDGCSIVSPHLPRRNPSRGGAVRGIAVDGLAVADWKWNRCLDETPECP